MVNVQANARITLNNILYLTDFSEPSEAALPFASAIARDYASKIYAFHVLIPKMYTYTAPEITALSIEAQEEAAEESMRQIDSQLCGVSHETLMERGMGIWPSLERAIKDHAIDLIVTGTNGRTGAQKLLLGSVAEEIFRSAHVPVLTIGPWARNGSHNGARFQRVLFATDLTEGSLAAAPYAISMAQENQAQLILVHVMKESDAQAVGSAAEDAMLKLMARMHEVVPASAEPWCRPEVLLQYGDPAEKILAVAKERQADLIVLGIRDAGGHNGAATHLERAVAHKVVVHATCPVLTVRGVQR